MIPKALQKVIGKIDPRDFPDPKLAKRFKEGSGRRYQNVGIATIKFYNGIAKQMKDKELKEYAGQIEQAVYDKDDLIFKTYSKMFQNRMAEMGVWKTIKGITGYQKVQVMGKIAKLARLEKKKQKEKDNKKKMVYKERRGC